MKCSDYFWDTSRAFCHGNKRLWNKKVKSRHVQSFKNEFLNQNPRVFPFSSQYVACYLHLHIHPAVHAHILTHTHLHLTPTLLTSGQYHPQSVCYRVVVNYSKERRKNKKHAVNQQVGCSTSTSLNVCLTSVWINESADWSTSLAKQEHNVWDQNKDPRTAQFCKNI